MEAKLSGGDVTVTSSNAKQITNLLMTGSISPEILNKNAFRFILCHVKVPEQFLEKFWNLFCDFDKCLVSAKQTLSEDFIAKYRDELSWRDICRYQTLSQGFICTMSDYVDWEMIWQYQTLEDGFKDEFRETAEAWISRYGKQVNSETRLGKVNDSIEPVDDKPEPIKPTKKKKKKLVGYKNPDKYVGKRGYYSDIDEFY